MSAHKPHLHAELLSPEVVAIIEMLQSWLEEAKFEKVVQDYAKSPRRHEVCVNDNMFEKLSSLFDEMKLKIQISDSSEIEVSEDLTQKSRLTSTNASDSTCYAFRRTNSLY
jgi:hypothetical protein